MDAAPQINDAPLTRPECSALVDRLRRESGAPNSADVLRLTQYAFDYTPEGINDWARADVVDYLKLRVSGYEETLRGVVLNTVVSAALTDIREARKRYELKAPVKLGEAVQLTFFGGDVPAIEWLHSIIESPGGFPSTYYQVASNELAAVRRELAAVPRHDAFMRAVRNLGMKSKGIVEIELSDVNEPEDDDSRHSSFGRAAQFGAAWTQYGFKPDRDAREEWYTAAALSSFARKQLHLQIVGIAKELGLDLNPDPEPRVEWYSDLKFPFIHLRRIAPPPPAPPKPVDSPGTPPNS